MVICLAEMARVFIFSPKMKNGDGKAKISRPQLTDILWIKHCLPSYVSSLRLSFNLKKDKVEQMTV